MKQAFVLQLHVNTEDEEEEGFVEDKNLEPTEPKLMQLSLYALNGATGSNTMRLMGMQGKQTLFILIDSGSTHNFLSEDTTRRMTCKLQPIEGVTVTVANR